jgi:hypothetical protein
MKLHVESVDNIRGQIVQIKEMLMKEQFCSGLSWSHMCAWGQHHVHKDKEFIEFLSLHLASFSIISNTLMDCCKPD